MKVGDLSPAALIVQTRPVSYSEAVLGRPSNSARHWRKHHKNFVRGWTPQEDERLIYLAGQLKSRLEMALDLGRSEAAVKDRLNRRLGITIKHLKPSTKKIERECAYCLKKFLVRQSKLAHDACRFCSMLCSSKSNIKIRTGPRPACYRGDEWPSIRRLYQFVWPFCSRCGTKTPGLSVHHIIPYRLTQDNDHKNLIVLCRSCHRTVEHSTRELLAIAGVDVARILLMNRLKHENKLWRYGRLRAMAIIKAISEREGWK